MLWSDLTLAFRTLRTQRAFSCAAILTLALGIGANSAIFSVIHAVLLAPLPFPNPSEVIAIHNIFDKPYDDHAVVDAADFVDFRVAQQTMTDIAILRSKESYSMVIGGEAEPLWGGSATPALFRILGVQPVAGRVFTEEEGQAGKDTVLLISEGLWRRRFGADPNAVGRRVIVNGVARTLIGILPAGFELGRAAEAWTPQVPGAAEIQRRFQHRYRMFGRLKPGVSLEQAQQDFERMNNEFKKLYPRTNAHGVHLVRYDEDRVRDVRGSLTLLWLASGLVLVIACANVASLLMARATGRQREVAIRAALGASRFRLLRGMLAESALLSLVGGAAGIGVAAGGLRLVAPLLPANLPSRDAIGIDGATLLFTLAAAVVTGVLFGMSPALQAAGASAAESLRQRSPAASGSGRRLRSALVVFEIALSVMLLVGGGLLLRTLLRVLDSDPGLDPSHVVTMVVSLPSTGRYAQPEAAAAYFQNATERIAQLPDVVASGAVNRLPLSGTLGSGPMSVEGHPTPPANTPTVNWRSATPDYFRALGIAMIAGRGISAHDSADAQQVVVIDDKLARTYWPNQDPIGKRVKLGNYDGDATWITVVGVVHTVRHDGLDVESLGHAYRPYLQYPVHKLPASSMAIVARVRGSAEGSAERIRRELLSVDSDQPPFDVRSMESVVASSVAPRRFSATLVGFFALLALVLASIGVYGVISYLVALRTNEIGIRMALGASPFDVARLIGGQTAALALTGLSLGLGGSLALAQSMRAFLFGVTPFDAISFGAAALAVVLVSLLATAQPARRAMRVDPVRALTAER
ncbi:MAG: ABC transporter permease [Bryobacteraceae bacterium]